MFDVPTNTISAPVSDDSSLIESVLHYLLSGGEPAPIVWFTIIVVALGGAFKCWLKYKSINLAIELDQIYRMNALEMGVPIIGASLTESVTQLSGRGFSLHRLSKTQNRPDIRVNHLEAAE